MRLARVAAITGAVCAGLVAPAGAGTIFMLSGVALEGVAWRWDAAPRTFSGFERSLDGGLRYAVSGGSLLAFRDQFSWSSVPSLVSFSAAVQQAFDAWATIDPVAGFRPALSFAYDSASTVEFVVGGGANFRGAEIDLIATTDASAWNIGSSSTQGETWVSTDPSKVRLTSGVVNYNHSSAITGADIYINSNPTAVYNLDLFRRLLTHEIGHALGLGDVETSINPGKFIDDNFAGNATAATTLNNSWASLVNPLDPAHSVGLSVFNIGSATSVSGVNLLMESSGLGIAAGNPVTNLVPLTNDEYGTRQFLYPEISPVAEPSTWLQMVAGASLMGWLAVRRRGQQPGRD